MTRRTGLLTSNSVRREATSSCVIVECSRPISSSRGERRGGGGGLLVVDLSPAGRQPATLTVGPIHDSRQKLILHQDEGLLKLQTHLFGGSVKANPTSENRELHRVEYFDNILGFNENYYTPGSY